MSIFFLNTRNTFIPDSGSCLSYVSTFFPHNFFFFFNRKKIVIFNLKKKKKEPILPTQKNLGYILKNNVYLHIRCKSVLSYYRIMRQDNHNYYIIIIMVLHKNVYLIYAQVQLNFNKSITPFQWHLKSL